MQRIALTLIASAASNFACAATPLTAQQILEQFNLVTLGNATSYSQDVEGRTYIGGTLTRGIYAAHTDDMTPSSYAGLTVAGSAIDVMSNNNGAVILGNLTNGTVQNNNSAYGATATVLGTATSTNFNVPAYVGANGGGNNFNGNPKTLSDQPATVAAASSTNFSKTLSDFSSSLSSLTGKSTYAINEPGKIVTFSAVTDTDANGLAVFDLSSLASNYYSGYKFLFSLGSATTVIMNVAATGSLTFSSSFDDISGYATLSQMASSVIWNFAGVTADLTTTNQFRGSILATSAKLINSGNVEGVVMVNELEQHAEIHHTAFTGNVTAVPEPETYAMMLGGLALMAGIARRRRAA